PLVEHRSAVDELVVAGEDLAVDETIEDLIQREDMVITVTHGGYIKRVPVSTYRAQRRGGKGRTGMSIKDDDLVINVFVASTHTPLLFLSSKGLAYRLKTYRLPQGGPSTRGKAMVNILPLSKDEIITTILPLPEDEQSWNELQILFATKKGRVRRNRLSDFASIRANGKIAMKLDADDRLIGASLCDGDQDVFLASRANQVIRFALSQQNSDGAEMGVRIFSGRTSTGVRGMRLKKDDELIQLALLKSSNLDSELRREYLQCAQAAKRLKSGAMQENSDELERDEIRVAKLQQEPMLTMHQNEEFILSVSSDGMGQLASAYDFRSTGRGGKGIANMDILKRKDVDIVASFPVLPERDQLLLITDLGQLIRINLSEIRQVGRKSKGVILFDLSEGEKIVSCAKIEIDDNDLDDDNQTTDGETT
ncbi:MAG: DNA gyrase C-terminal beta-propeller domain-containing protein, partial [Pseudomonadota bacterium]